MDLSVQVALSQEFWPDVEKRPDVSSFPATAQTSRAANWNSPDIFRGKNRVSGRILANLPASGSLTGPNRGSPAGGRFSATAGGPFSARKVALWVVNGLPWTTLRRSGHGWLPRTPVHRDCRCGGNAICMWWAVKLKDIRSDNFLWGFHDSADGKTAVFVSG